MADDIQANFELELEALSLLDQLQKEKDAAIDARRQNLPKNIPNARKAFANNKNVKSDLKKSNAFVKKIKSINAEGLQQCIRDADTLNLTLFISEIVDAILATAYKPADATYVTKLCISLHQKYEEFTEPLITGLKTRLLSPASEDDAEAGKKKRIQIRLVIELYQAGLFNDDEFFAQLLRMLLGKKPSPQSSLPARQVMDLPGLSTFVKYGSETFFGYLPRKVVEVVTRGGKSAADVPSKLYASARVSGDMKQLLATAYEQLSTDLVKAHTDFRQKEIKFEKDKLIHGILAENKAQELDNARKLFEKLLSVVTSLSECTGDKVPELIFEKEEEEEGKGSLLSVWGDGHGGASAAAEDSGGLYGDPESRAFYEDLPDLLTMVPLTVLGMTPDQVSAMRLEWEEKKSKDKQEEANVNAVEGDSLTEAADAAEGEAMLEEQEEGRGDAGGTKTLAPASGGSGDAASTLPSAQGGGAGEEGLGETRADKLFALLEEKLPDCVTKAKADEFCVSFCYLNTKYARKQLALALSRLPRSRIELATQYARIVASLSRLYPDILPPILDALRKEFFGMLKTKRQLNLESKLRNVRYQAELVKFRVAPPIVAFRIIRALLQDFTHNHVQLLAAFMESCGRFLYLLPYTQSHMNDFLATMLRLRSARNLDVYHQSLLESAYFAVKPPERSPAVAKKTLTDAQKWARYLLTQRLDDPTTNVDHIIKSLRRLPWAQPEECIAQHVQKVSLRIARSKYTLIPNLADCLSGLMKYYPNIIVAVVDRIWEEIQRALDSPYKREMQRVLGVTRLLGELYNYTAITASVLFDVLYHLISFGHAIPSDATSPLSGGGNAAGGGQSTSQGAQNPAATASSVVGGAGGAAAMTAQTFVSFFVPGSVEKAALDNKFDPRIPCDADPPSDVFRAQVACELIKTVGTYFVRDQNKERMARYLLYFQRYLLTKQMIPMHVEFMILDMFDFMEEHARSAAKETAKKQPKTARLTAEQEAALATRVMFARFDTLEAAQQAIEALQESQGGHKAWEEEDETAAAGTAGGEGKAADAKRGSTAGPASPPAAAAAAPLSSPTSNTGATAAGAAGAGKGAKAAAHASKASGGTRPAAAPSSDQNAPPVQDEEDEEDDDSDGSDEDEDDEDDEEGEENSSGESSSGDDNSDSEDDSDDDSDDSDEDDDGEDEDEDVNLNLDEDGEDEDDISEREAARMLDRLRIAEEDEEFDRAFKNVIQESVSSVANRHQDVNRMVIPAVLPKPKNISSFASREGEGSEEAARGGGAAATSAAAAARDADAPSGGQAGEKKVVFRLLSRDNKGRVETRQLLVPEQSPMAVKLMKAEEEQRIAREKLKQRVLLIDSMNADVDNQPDDMSAESFTGQSNALLPGGSFSSTTPTVGAARGHGSSHGGGGRSGGGGGGRGGVHRVMGHGYGQQRGEDSKRSSYNLDLDSFLAEANASEIRRLGGRGAGRG